MEKTPILKELKEHIKIFKLREQPTYVLFGSSKAIALYNQSLDALLKSDHTDYNVRSYGREVADITPLDDTFPIDDYYLIDQSTYEVLHAGLCKKLYLMVSGM